MSVGNVSQAITFTDDDLVLVLGENLDLGGDGNRNGVGKSTILNALSYALYGEALVKIKKDNLVNKINAKGMMTTLDFEKDGIQYRIERGRKPGVLRFMVNGTSYDEDADDEAQGDNRLTQVEIERIIGISHDMFKQIVALNTYSEPFLSLRSGDQRNIIEQLLGITKLSEKAEKLREQLKVIKDASKEEELRITATKTANEAVQRNIRAINIKSTAWEKTHAQTIRDLDSSIVDLSGLDVDVEIESHRANAENAIKQTELNTLTQKKKAYDKEIKLYTRNLTLIEKNLAVTHDSKTCPTCNSEMNKDTHEKVHQGYVEEQRKALEKVEDATAKLGAVAEQIENCKVAGAIKTTYSDVEDAYNHRATIQELQNSLERETVAENPFTAQVESLAEDGLQVIDYAYTEELITLKDHQEFLLKLLVNKDSFIRKKIIDQNLLYLNNRLSHYIGKVGLPHDVKFRSDLEVEITQYGKDYDFDNLSRGERTRLILSLSMAFRDVFESLNDKINLLFIDELLDAGLDSTGVEAALGVLKTMTREQKRNVFLVSHKDELIGRVSSILKVTKEAGFTSFQCDDTQL